MLESRGEGGNDVDLSGTNAGETTFLKPKSSAGREPTAGSIGLRHSKGSHFRSKHAMVLEDGLSAASSVSSSTSSKPSEGQHLKQQQHHGSNDSDSDSGGNPLTNVKLAIPVGFSLSEEGSGQLASSHGSRKWLSGKTKATSENKQGSPSIAEGSTDTDSSMSLHLQRNVFSLEQLEAAERTLLTTHSEPEPDTSDSDTESAPAFCLKNVHSLNELELVGDNADTKDRDMDFSSSTKPATTSHQVEKEPETADGGRKSRGFRFSAAGDNIPLANTHEGEMRVVPKFESPSEIFPDRKCAIKDHSDGHSYSDDNFESGSWSGEEEEIVEELSGEEHSSQAVDDVWESSGGTIQSHPASSKTGGSGVTSQKTTQSQEHVSPHVEKREPSAKSDDTDTDTEKELTYTSFTEQGPNTSGILT